VGTSQLVGQRLWEKRGKGRGGSGTNPKVRFSKSHLAKFKSKRVWGQFIKRALLIGGFPHKEKNEDYVERDRGCLIKKLGLVIFKKYY